MVKEKINSEELNQVSGGKTDEKSTKKLLSEDIFERLPKSTCPRCGKKYLAPDRMRVDQYSWYCYKCRLELRKKNSM